MSRTQILHDLGTYLNKAIPDTKLTIKKYADVKFEYLSYCLKVCVRVLDDKLADKHPSLSLPPLLPPPQKKPLYR